MGKHHKNKGKPRNSEEKRRRQEQSEEWKNKRGDGRDEETVKTNPIFEAFYRAQGFINSDEEFEQFLETLRAGLPACFRLNLDYPFIDELRKELLSYAGQSIEVEGHSISAVENMAWYKSAYKLGTDRRALRKLPILNELHKWMVRHTENGNISRQEAVSMVPPLALNVSPHHKCLDMCAAPGSKTAQLLEIVHRSANDPAELQGVVVANDSDTDRVYMLAHQCRRINSPLLLITTHKGQEFPRIYGKGVVKVKGNPPDGFFDRILCDVPCSGDGTLRKNPSIWKKWNTGGSFSLHVLQLMIANRGVELLKTDGLLVYSTCSLSPYEDEACVAELLRSSNGSLELVDAREFLPNFKARPGLKSWYVLDDSKVGQNFEKKRRVDESNGDADETGNAGDTNVKEDAAGPTHSNPYVQKCLDLGMTLFETFDDVPSLLKKKIRKSVFPPTAEENEWMHLEKCLRCVPHDEDTGGFFVATLRKVRSTRKTSAIVVEEADTKVVQDATDDIATSEVKLTDENDADNNNDKNSNNRKKGLIEFVTWDNNSFQKVADFHGFTPELQAKNFFSREDMMSNNKDKKNSGISKCIYYIPNSVLEVMNGDLDDRIKVVTSGIKMFERKGNNAGGEMEYRILQEGLSVIAPFITKRKISVTIQDFCNLLGGGLVSFSTLSESTVNSLTALDAGILICVYEFSFSDVLDTEGTPSTTSNTDNSLPHQLHCVCWRGKGRTMNVMCGKTEMELMKHQLQSLRVLRPKVFANKTDNTNIDDAKTGDVALESNVEVTETNDSIIEMET